jgi:creatinine deaminase
MWHVDPVSYTYEHSERTKNATNAKDLMFMGIAIEEAKKSASEGGIPIGAVLVKENRIIGKGHNRRIQNKNPLCHAEMDCLENAFKNHDYSKIIGSTIYTTSMPCNQCGGTIIQHGLCRVVSGENKTFPHSQILMESRGICVTNLDLEECKLMLKNCIKTHPEYWNTTPKENSPLDEREDRKFGEQQVDWNTLTQNLFLLLRSLNVQLGWFDEECLKNSPGRIMRFYRELFAKNEERFAFTTFEAPKQQVKEPIMLTKIRTYPLCKHHMLPFRSDISIEYLPSEKICGLSKLSRIAIKFSSKPTIQEDLTTQIVNFVNDQLHPIFATCIIEGRHFCSIMRGVKQTNSVLTTQATTFDPNKLSELGAKKLSKEFMKIVKSDTSDKLGRKR